MYGHQVPVPKNPLPPPSRKDRKTRPIKQECNRCGDDEMPKTNYPHHDKKSTNYKCTKCKNADLQNKPFGNVTYTTSMARTQKPENIRCASCKKIPEIVDPFVRVAFQEIPASIILDYLRPIANQLVLVDSGYHTLACKRRLCLNCYEILVNANHYAFGLFFYGCPCKKPHVLR